ncbi:uncharacterized protein LOC124283664 [Haliotis rubra]|uniref:uncharacterized protein LOC124283664 n=1 Tax=Haliotis rubra TaxID=36100 RepID=UPI001EE5645D|nr:uncharacterized protein LOC124283664 [Haliotis rubra]
MAPSHTNALPATTQHGYHRYSFTKRTSQDALIPTMGCTFFLPLLQLIVTLLALSECLPIPTGGTTPGITSQYPATNALPVPITADATRAVIQSMEKLWIQRFENSDYFKQLPKGLQEDVKEFLNSRTRNILQGDQSLTSQENNLRKNIPRPHGGDSLSVTDSLKSNEITLEAKRNGQDSLDKSKSNNVTVVVGPTRPGHRSRRSYGRSYLDNRISPYLSGGPIDITYTHVVPCVYADRYYCLNGGTCVFVGALDLKTCRCPMGYTGLRCEMIDQEYILSLLTNSIMFD